MRDGVLVCLHQPVPPPTAADPKINIIKLAQTAMAQVVPEGGGDEAGAETSLEKTCELSQGAFVA